MLLHLAAVSLFFQLFKGQNAITLLCFGPRVALFSRKRAVGAFFPNDLRGGFRKLKEQGVGNRRFGAGPVPKSLLLLLLLLL